MTEIDTKKEIEILTKEFQALEQQRQQLQGQLNAIVNEMVKKQGAIELLQRLDGRKTNEEDKV